MQLEKKAVLCSYMKENPYPDDQKEMKELLMKYQKLRSGSDFHYLEEEAFEKIIDYYDENEQLNLAMEAAERGIGQFPFSSLLLIKKADLLIASHLFSEALDILEKVSVLDISDMNLHILKIDAWLGLGNQNKAKTLFDESMAMYEGPEKITFLFELADVFDDYEMFDEVFDCLKGILLEDPLNEEALFKICFWTDYAQKYAESIELHTKLIDEHPYSHLAWFNLGTAFQGLNLHEKAIDAYLYSIAINEKFDYAYRNLGDAYICIKNFKEAAEALEKVLELSLPEDVIYEALGHCYQKMKDPVQARINYRKALHLSPEDSQIYYKIATTYIAEEKWSQAIDQLERAVSIQPKKNADYHFALGQCYSKLGNFQQAIDSLAIFISARPSNIKGWKELIIVLFDNACYEEALYQCNMALKQTKGKAVFEYYKAALFIKSGKRKEGLVQLETAIEKAPRQLREFIALDPSFLQRASVVRVINAHFHRREKSKKKRK